MNQAPTSSPHAQIIDRLSNTLEREMLIAYKQDQVKDCEHTIPGRLYCCEPVHGWADLAQMLSCNLPGQFWVGSNSLCWVNGSKVYYFAPKGRLPAIIDARSIVSDVTGLPDASIPYSVSGCARKLIDWLGFRQESGRALDCIGAADSWQYQHCDPVDLPQAYLWDLTSCYYALLCRAPSPRVILLNNKLFWCPVTKEEQRRWDTMLVACKPHKGLRNSFIGQMYAASDGMFFWDGECNQSRWSRPEIEYLRAADGVTLYQNGLHLDHSRLDERHRDEEKQAKPGPFRPLASLVVRTAYELCALAQQETRAFYANTDCVITESPTSPQIWAKYGLGVSCKGHGQARIYAVGYYEVGSTKTKHVLNAEARGLPVASRPRVPAQEEKITAILRGRLWCDEWLKISPSKTPGGR